MLTLRGVRARAGQSTALFLMGVVVVAGCVIAAGYSRQTHGSIAAAAPLLLLGVVALANQGAASARSRRAELALAQLRGRGGLRLLRSAVTEPTLILLAGAAVGTGLGWLGARMAVKRWADGSFTMTLSEWATAATALVVSVLVVVLVSWRSTFEPLTDKLGRTARPRAATTVGIFLSLLVVLGAAVSVYQARQLGVAAAGWVSFVSPALLGLAAGLVGVWLVALLSRLARGTAALNRTVGRFVTLRRLTRVADTVAVIPIVVAAVAVAGVAGSAWAGAASWRTAAARMETGGPVTFAVPGGGLAAYAASHEADPQGRWLMAATAAAGSTVGSYRDVFVDSPRWRRVVGDFYAGTPVDAVTRPIGGLATAATGPQIASGARATVTMTAASVHRYLPSPGEVRRRQGNTFGGYPYSALTFAITFVDVHGNVLTALVPAHSGTAPTPRRPGIVEYSSRVHALSTSALACDFACTVLLVDVQGVTRGGKVRVTGLTFGDAKLVPLPKDGMSLAYSDLLEAVPAPAGGLDLGLYDPYRAHPLLNWAQTQPQPALATADIRLEERRGQPVAYGLDGEPLPIRITDAVPALPLIGRQGVLLDLGTALRGAGSQIPTSKAMVVARADTPPAVLGALHDTGAVGKQQTVTDTTAQIRKGDAAQSTLLYTLIAAFGVLIALLSLVSAVAGQRPERRTEAASLRLVGVDSRAVDAGYREEAQALGVAVGVVAGVAVWLAGSALLGVLPLVNPGRFGLPFDPAPPGWLVIGIALTAGMAVALVLFFGFRRVGRSAAPRLLREEA